MPANASVKEKESIMIKKSVLLCLGFVSICQLSAQDKQAYTRSTNLQQESTRSYIGKQDSTVEDPYHYQDREEYEIPFGRPILNPDFSDPVRYYDFMTEQVDKFLKNYQDLLQANMNNGTDSKLDNIRYSSLQHLQYAAYRYKHIEAEEFGDYNKQLLANFRALDAIYRKDINEYLKKRAIKDNSYFYWEEYYKAETSLFNSIYTIVSDLFAIKKDFDSVNELKNKPDYRLEYKLRELNNIQAYRERLYEEYLKVWFKGEEFFKFVDNWDQSGMEKSKELTLTYSKQAGLNLKTIDKYKNNITFKNTINKYIKYVQTSSKNTFKKISDIVTKKEKNKANTKAINEIYYTYKTRERAYLKQIRDYFNDMVKTNLGIAKIEAEKQKLKDIKEREQREKEEKRIKAKQDRWQ